MESNSFFISAKPSKLFFSVALPGMVSMLAMSIYSVIEGAFIGNLLGEAAFAAVNIAMPLVMINFSLADLIGVGSSVPISIALGQKDNKRANNYFTCSLIMIFLVSLFMGIFLFTCAPALVQLMGAEGDLASYSIKYVRVYAMLSPVTTLTFAMDNYLRVSGFVKLSMILNVFMSILTIGLLSLFIIVFQMNVEGSALATCLAMATCVCIGLIPFLRGKALLKFAKPTFSATMIKQIVSCGTPVFLNNIAGRLAAIVMNVALLRTGGQTAVAAYSVLMYASDIINPMLYGMSDSVQPAIGYNWGARQLHRVQALGKLSFAACAVVSMIGTAVMFFFPQQISSLFIGTEDAALMDMTVHAMKLFCTAYLFRWFGFAIQGFFSAIEKPLPATILSVASALVFPIFFVYALAPLGLDGLWLNLAATSLVVSAMAFFMLLKVQKQLTKNMVSHT